jgi:hypothetical protein
VLSLAKSSPFPQGSQHPSRYPTSPTSGSISVTSTLLTPMQWRITASCYNELTYYNYACYALFAVQLIQASNIELPEKLINSSTVYLLYLTSILAGGLLAFYQSNAKSVLISRIRLIASSQTWSVAHLHIAINLELPFSVFALLWLRNARLSQQKSIYRRLSLGWTWITPGIPGSYRGTVPRHRFPRDINDNKFNT